MRVHVIGAGPTGMSVAWEILRSTDHQVTIYDRKESAGGSWWEPSGGKRDLHAHRIVFDNAFVNTNSLFEEMGIEWDDIFQPADTDVYKTVFKNLKPMDYLTLAVTFTIDYCPKQLSWVDHLYNLIINQPQEIEKRYSL